MIPGFHPVVQTDRAFCPGFDIQGKMPAAQVPAGICLEEDGLIFAFAALHAVFLRYSSGTEMLNLVPIWR